MEDVNKFMSSRELAKQMGNVNNGRSCDFQAFIFKYLYLDNNEFTK